MAARPRIVFSFVIAGYAGGVAAPEPTRVRDGGEDPAGTEGWSDGGASWTTVEAGIPRDTGVSYTPTDTAPPPDASEAFATNAVARAVNGATGEHFYTLSAAEA